MCLKLYKKIFENRNEFFHKEELFLTFKYKNMLLENHWSLESDRRDLNNARLASWKSRLQVQRGITRTEKEIIESILFSLHWFNIWFALEVENGAERVRENIKKILQVSPENKWIVELVDTILNDKSLYEKAKEYAEYKKWVEERARNSSMNFWL